MSDAGSRSDGTGRVAKSAGKKWVSLKIASIKQPGHFLQRTFRRMSGAKQQFRVQAVGSPAVSLVSVRTRDTNASNSSEESNRVDRLDETCSTRPWSCPCKG